ncbi:uncharacterized protein LOC118423113 isoform X1 [Branchiostoma floridae]|uniref:Uncharacterized protein LOC118423113 isoform X1 n=1 Tax=Branchiostoma floridae TaxID=7739 RepID=A0A9J7LQV4_BRAFL|nr:uncharacterized protein LOC118423113 isoform X1 [Branchiostoma floridae]
MSWQLTALVWQGRSDHAVCNLELSTVPESEYTNTYHHVDVDNAKRNVYIVEIFKYHRDFHNEKIRQIFHCTVKLANLSVPFTINSKIAPDYSTYNVYSFFVIFQCRLGEVCSHVAALLFAVEASRSLQEKRTSCTSRKAVWNKYYKDKVDPQRAEDMDFSHPKHGVQIKKARRKPQCDVPPLSEEEAASAFSQLRKLCPTASAVIKEEEDTDTASEDESDVNTETLPPVVYRSCHPAKVPVTSVSVDSILDWNTTVYDF